MILALQCLILIIPKKHGCIDSHKNCQWYSTFLDVAEDICIEKMAEKRADEIKIFLQKIQILPIVTIK